ncbi:helicase HerA-like domain-containing protein [Arcticibacterium luteifluviistationis]|uniref:ATPase n=1 Tax=Arcticibacterium luteifluviistationis TaxID=1784714 RepID=A0A2Z4G6C4_9BACT|nr:helicase HerA-like domain-containing protein [Arcticibacterium luteifluviistationis]AWV96691.1 ATPase [Arcticibacterium luteifluviistationis]
MSKIDEFRESINKGYTFKGDSILLGAAKLDDKVVPNTGIKIPLKTLNRHGLIAGATGTGKTKSLQVLTEGLSENSIPVLLMDIKGDLSGLAAKGVTEDFILARTDAAGIKYEPSAFPVELLSLSDEKGVKLRATVSEFGPILLGKVLGLNDTQEGIVSAIFKYCDDEGLALLDLKDFIKVLQYLTDEGKKEFEQDYGRISTTSLGTIMRKVIELQQQGADQFFGETSFDVDDLMKIDDKGRGVISVLKVTDLLDRPKLFSTFMLSLLAELYAGLPEAGDEDRPKLIIFIDEAHLVFQEASKALLQQIETVIKLIRSKGVGIYFCTQNPQDIPAPVLSQLGLKIQHALRAFTASDRRKIKEAADNYPLTDFFDTEELLTSMGIGEALVTALDEKGRPTPLAVTYMCPPRSRMDVLTEDEIDDIVDNSKLAKKYNKDIDRESAYEILSVKMEKAAEETESAPKPKRGRPAKEKSTMETILGSSAARQMGRTAANLLTRTLLGALGVSTRKKNWF